MRLHEDLANANNMLFFLSWHDQQPTKYVPGQKLQELRLAKFDTIFFFFIIIALFGHWFPLSHQNLPWKIKRNCIVNAEDIVFLSHRLEDFQLLHIYFQPYIRCSTTCVCVLCVNWWSEVNLQIVASCNWTIYMYVLVYLFAQTLYLMIIIVIIQILAKQQTNIPEMHPFPIFWYALPRFRLLLLQHKHLYIYRRIIWVLYIYIFSIYCGIL